MIDDKGIIDDMINNTLVDDNTQHDNKTTNNNDSCPSKAIL